MDKMKEMTRMLSVTAIAIAGLIHLILAPAHFEHAPAHGIFFALAGAAEILWAVAFWRRPSQPLYYAGLALAGGLIVLWALTRLAIPPFEHEPGPVDASGLVCKLSELAGFISLIALAAQGQISNIAGKPAWRLAGIALGLALLSGLALYGIGRAAEPLLSSLASPGEHAEGESLSDHGMEGGDMPGHEGMDGDHPAASPSEAVTIGDLIIEGIWSRPSSAGANGVIYLSITNAGHDAERLVGAQTEAAGVVELHQSKMDGDVMKMEPVPGGIELPPGATVKLEPGGYHLMLVDLQRDLTPGEHYVANLQFEKAGEVSVEVAVVAP
jgi:copper(I)-binding protein